MSFELTFALFVGAILLLVLAAALLGGRWS